MPVERQLSQVLLARDLAALSPMHLVQDLIERAVGSGPYRDGAFLDQAWAFGDRLAEHVRELDRKDPDSPHILFMPRYLSQNTVDSEAVPRFDYREATLREGLELAASRIGLLAFATALLLLANLVGFARYSTG